MAKHLVLYVALHLLFTSNLLAKLSLPAVFGDHMVLQRESEVLLWGWGDPLEKIEVSTSWDGAVYIDTVDNHANWSVQLATPKAGGPFEITIAGGDELTLKDILIGEVWVCSGQSNMEWSANHGYEKAEETVANANNDQIRLFHVPKRSADYPQIDLKATWQECKPETVQPFSAVAYSFGLHLQEKLGVPVGLIHSSWGGTPAETWIAQEVIEQDAYLKEGAYLLDDLPWCPYRPGKAYNAMIAPITDFKIGGAIWYQGETNTRNANYYTSMFEALIHSWRSEWGYDFPFFYVQIAPFRYRKPEVGAWVRDAQRRIDIENTGMVVISDIGDTADIHPRKKLQVGERLSNLALKKHYGFFDTEVEGPVLKEVEYTAKKAILYFDHADGLYIKGKESLFEIAGADKVFHPANYRLSDQNIVLTNPKVKAPAYVRFAWGNTLTGNLFNAVHLPASSFTTEKPEK